MNIKNTKFIDLSNLQLKTFTEQDASDYCLLNNIDSNNIIELTLYKNQLRDISGIKLFKNLEILYLHYNEIKDISALKDLNNLKSLNINDNEIKDISVLKDLKNLKYLDIRNLELESNQIQYINSLKNLHWLMCYNAFKNKSVVKQLNKNIVIELE